MSLAFCLAIMASKTLISFRGGTPQSCGLVQEKIGRKKKMSTTNTSEQTSVKATDAQVGHVKDLITGKLRSLDNGQIQPIIEDGGEFQRRFNAMLDGLVGELTNTYTVTVNYDQTLDEAVKAVNPDYKYVSVSNDQLPRNGSGTQEVKLILFSIGEYVSQKQLDAELEKRGLEFDPMATLALGAQFPELQRSKPYASTWKDSDDRYYSVYLRGIGGERRLCVDQDDDDWDGSWWFAARRKELAG